ncbi:hypothetical protein Tco_1228533 [Tanacetum coccineum]
MSQPANDDYSQHLSDDEASYHEDASDSERGNGNSKKRISTGKYGVVRILPPVSPAEIHAVEKERKARTILLMAIPKEHLKRFHGMDDAKEIWEAIRTRFGEAGKQEKNQMGLLTMDDGIVNWGEHTEDEEINHALMAISSSSEKGTIAENIDSWKDVFQETWRLINFWQCVQVKRRNSVGKPLYSRFIKSNDFKGVPHPLSGDYTPKPQEEIDESLYVYGKKGSQEPEPSISDDRSINLKKCYVPYKPITTNEKGMSALKSKEVEPSCVTHIKTPRQPIKDQETPKVNRKNWNKIMESELGEGYSFIKKKCFVCGSLSHLIKDCDYYEKKMAREAEFKKQRVFNTGNRVTKPVWTNENRVNHANKFVPKPVQLNAGQTFISVRPNINTGRVNVNSVRPNVNTGRVNVNSVKSNINTGRTNVNPRVNTGSSNVNTPDLWIVVLRIGKLQGIGEFSGVGFISTRQMFGDDAIKQWKDWISLDVNTDSDPVATDSIRVSVPSPDRGLAEAIRFDALEKDLEKEEVAKQVHLDSLLAQRMAEEQELTEEQKKRKAQVQFEAQSYTEEDWDTIRAKLEANAKLRESVLEQDLTVEDYAKRMMELQLDTYVPMNFEATKESLKRFGEELQTKTAKKLKFDDEKLESGEVDITSSKIVKWKILRHGGKGYCHLIRANQRDSVFTTAYGPEEDLERAFAENLRIMFDPPQSEDTVWSLPMHIPIVNWRYYDSCNVHCLNLHNTTTIYMLAERSYPLSEEVCRMMLKKKLFAQNNEVKKKLVKSIEKKAGIKD